ncbi:hypothetical protein ABIE67_000041 [Streptomyces sp. V4I8]|uniref:hypothetical protein n=1 Tax=Streptomyces sp. V4I8 TaxID=3156469 RepID=UPI003512900C
MAVSDVLRMVTVEPRIRALEVAAGGRGVVLVDIDVEEPLDGTAAELQVAASSSDANGWLRAEPGHLQLRAGRQTVTVTVGPPADALVGPYTLRAELALTAHKVAVGPRHVALLVHPRRAWTIEGDADYQPFYPEVPVDVSFTVTGPARTVVRLEADWYLDLGGSEMDIAIDRPVRILPVTGVDQVTAHVQVVKGQACPFLVRLIDEATGEVRAVSSDIAPVPSPYLRPL